MSTIHHQEKLLLHKYIVYLSVPIIGFQLLMQLLPFMIPGQLPTALYQFSFPLFLGLYILIIVSSMTLQLFRNTITTITNQKNLLYVIGIVTILIFFGDFFANGLFSGIAPAIFFRPIVFGSLLRTAVTALLLFIGIKLTSLYIQRHSLQHSSSISAK